MEYFYKSKRIYKYTFRLALAALVAVMIPNDIGIHPIIKAMSVTLPFIALGMISPIGLFYIIKSYTRREPPHRYRFLYVLGHSAFILIFVVMAIDVIKVIAIS